MESSGQSEFSGNKKEQKALTLNFWQSFLVTLSGAAGLISLVADGPLWLSVTGFSLVIIVIFWVAISQVAKKK